MGGVWKRVIEGPVGIGTIVEEERGGEQLTDLDNPSLFDEASLSLRGNFFLFAPPRYRGKEYRCNVGETRKDQA